MSQATPDEMAAINAIEDEMPDSTEFMRRFTMFEEQLESLKMENKILKEKMALNEQKWVLKTSNEATVMRGSDQKSDDLLADNSNSRRLESEATKLQTNGTLSSNPNIGPKREQSQTDYSNTQHTPIIESSFNKHSTKYEKTPKMNYYKSMSNVTQVPTFYDSHKTVTSYGNNQWPYGNNPSLAFNDNMTPVSSAALKQMTHNNSMHGMTPVGIMNGNKTESMHGMTPVGRRSVNNSENSSRDTAPLALNNNNTANELTTLHPILQTNNTQQTNETQIDSIAKTLNFLHLNRNAFQTTFESGNWDEWNRKFQWNQQINHISNADALQNAVSNLMKGKAQQCLMAVPESISSYENWQSFMNSTFGGNNDIETLMKKLKNGPQYYGSPNEIASDIRGSLAELQNVIRTMKNNGFSDEHIESETGNRRNLLKIFIRRLPQKGRLEMAKKETTTFEALFQNLAVIQRKIKMHNVHYWSGDTGGNRRQMERNDDTHTVDHRRQKRNRKQWQPKRRDIDSNQRWNTDRSQNNGSNKTFNGTCFNCGRFGHKKIDCVNPPKHTQTDTNMVRTPLMLLGPKITANDDRLIKLETEEFGIITAFFDTGSEANWICSPFVEESDPTMKYKVTPMALEVPTLKETIETDECITLHLKNNNEITLETMEFRIVSCLPMGITSIIGWQAMQQMNYGLNHSYPSELALSDTVSLRDESYETQLVITDLSNGFGTEFGNEIGKGFGMQSKIAIDEPLVTNWLGIKGGTEEKTTLFESNGDTTLNGSNGITKHIIHSDANQQPLQHLKSNGLLITSIIIGWIGSNKNQKIRK